MADVKVYKGGVPMGGFDSMMGGTEYKVSGEGESSYVPGQSDATRPKVVKDGGSTQPMTYDKKASANFLDDASYNTIVPEGFQARKAFELPMDIDNPDTISHADHTDDPDLPRK